MNSTLETYPVSMRLLNLNERRRLLCTRVSYLSTKGDMCCVRASPLSQLKETIALNPRLLYHDEQAKFWGHAA
jgi:hypothetical protein